MGGREVVVVALLVVVWALVLRHDCWMSWFCQRWRLRATISRPFRPSGHILSPQDQGQQLNGLDPPRAVSAALCVRVILSLRRQELRQI
ncbi:hydrolase [Histoplasma capsulatum var. duboisii H88]|uniref:Hydrolase n=1 Tax=Ajellomyces capsulatus (strain H88) TaxID=544711 RepID=A0A8A1LTF6_AJEC8|nr:hydrolase [Histoplasma capsulatum var. duboisii H88]